MGTEEAAVHSGDKGFMKAAVLRVTLTSRDLDFWKTYGENFSGSGIQLEQKHELYEVLMRGFKSLVVMSHEYEGA